MYCAAEAATNATGIERAKTTDVDAPRQSPRRMPSGVVPGVINPRRWATNVIAVKRPPATAMDEAYSTTAVRSFP